jgi:hypothetical protein
LSGRKISSYRCERQQQLGKRAFNELLLEMVKQTVAFEQAASQADVDKSDDPLPVE